jgi:hypothetical protein
MDCVKNGFDFILADLSGALASVQIEISDLTRLQSYLTNYFPKAFLREVDLDIERHDAWVGIHLARLQT